MIASLVSFVSRLTKREKAAFYGALIIASFLVLDHLMLRPILTKIEDLNEEIVRTEASAKKALGVIDREEELLNRASMYAAYLKNPGSDDTVKRSLMDYIENLARHSSVVVEEIRADLKTATGEEDAGLKRYATSLRCEGEMKEVISFFYDIEKSEENLLKIENFSMLLKGRDSNAIICTMEITRYVIL